ncbi:MAG: thioesterase family protein [Chloroflexota bacterium]|nr:thioesterase family protein [Chloroflexota bacterium]
MGRIKLEMPDNFDYTTEVPIRISDINYGGHLGHDAILPLTHEARVRFLKQLGYSELSIEGAASIMADAIIVYKGQGFYGQTLKIEIAARNFSKRGLDFLYRLTDTQTGNEIALVKTGMVFFDYAKQKPIEVPPKFRAALTGI